MKLLCILMLVIFLQACASRDTQDIIYTNSWQDDWKKAKLKECNMEVSVIVLSVFEARIGTPHALTKEDVQELHNKMMTSCLNYYKLFI